MTIMKKHLLQNRVFIILLHLLAWLIFFFIPYFLRPDILAPKNFPRPPFFTWDNFVQHLLLAAVFYFNAYWLIPRLLNKKMTTAYILSLAAIVAVNYGIGVFRMNHIRPAVFHHRVSVTGQSTVPDRIIEPPGRLPAVVRVGFPGPFYSSVFLLLFILAVSTAYRFFLDKIRLDKLHQARETEHLRSELGFLRSQISPHFIFNILNSAVSLSRTQPQLVEPTLIRLSGLMRYMLYDAEDTRVPLNQEIEYLESYIELQRLRFGDRVDISFSRSGLSSDFVIEPMLLIPFVENAFKHGVGQIQGPRIVVELKESDGVLFFSVKNRYNIEEKNYSDRYSGIGLPNVRKRLDLLYGQHYLLQILKSEEWYEIELKVPLK